VITSYEYILKREKSIDTEGKVFMVENKRASKYEEDPA